MCCLMNLLWLLLGGIFTAVEYLISSLLMMLTIIGIPFGMQTLKLAGLALWPFGKEVRSGNRSGGCLYILMNILWIFLGWHLDLSVTFGFRGYIVHYHYRNPFWIATLQVGIFGIIAFWERHCNSVRVVGREYAYN